MRDDPNRVLTTALDVDVKLPRRVFCGYASLRRFDVSLLDSTSRCRRLSLWTRPSLCEVARRSLPGRDKSLHGGWCLGVALRVQCVQPFGAIFGAGDGPVDESLNPTRDYLADLA
jgi:hypothetical protein